MKLNNFRGFKLVDKALLIEQTSKKILVLADLHIGFEEALNKQGIFLPRTMFKEIMKEAEKLFGSSGKIDEIIILGDLKHEFGKISRQEWQEVLSFLDFLKTKCKKIVLVKGNHDTILEPIIRQREQEKIEIKDFYVIDDICFIHGHKMFSECLDKKIKTLVLGHLHPAVTIHDKTKSERYKCFLVGRWKGKKIIILPSFFPLVEGADVFIEDTNLAFNFNLKKFKVYAVGDKIYEFGELGEIEKI